jgi:serine/threonine protein kinase
MTAVTVPILELLGERFDVRARVGEGAVGIVYDAFDRERGTRVAVKTLRTVSAELLLSLKNEFRAVQDLQHPNLVSLGELFEARGTWFFTMEFVEGTDLVRYARPGDPRVPSSPPPPLALARAPASTSPAASEPASKAHVFDEARLRDALAQLVRGLSALHAANKLHRDIKPSNVLVTHEGRVVILDFGLARDLARAEGDHDDRMVGTAAYMAPEQALGDAVGPAADWYSVGAVLYEALTGRLPFVGRGSDQLEQKLREEAPPPRSIAATVPEDLNALCIDLLRMSPEARPGGAEILQRLGAAPAADALGPAKPASIFIGRHRELTALDAAHARAAERRAVTACVHGESGVGKSFLVRRFIDDVRAREPHALVLVGRCYERESVPYKAVDGVIDQLSRFLLTLDAGDAEEMMGGDRALLARAFPVLAAADVALDEEPSSVVPHELRARVFAASRRLFGRLAARGPLILVIDDLQWADLDSLSLLAEIMRPPDAPSMLLVATMRGGADLAAEAARADLAARIGGDVRYVHVEQLHRDEARELASRLLGRAAASDAEIDAIVSEAQGHPLFIDELVRQRATHGDAQSMKLDDALWARVTRLDAPARRLLEVIAIAGLPMAQEIVADAAELDPAQIFSLGAVLRAASFVKTGGPRRGDPIEPYHDRVRESVLAHLDDPARAAWHGRLAAALERATSADAEALATHWQGAGRLEKAAEYAERAAANAVGALAFDRAARLYRRCLELRAGDDAAAWRRSIRERLAAALTDGGYVAQAAEVHLELAADARGDQAIDRRRIAAEHLLCSGHFDRGLSLLRTVLAAVRIYFPRSPLAVILALLTARLVLWVRGTSFRERDARAIDAHALVRIDAVWSAGAGFSMSDNIRGAYFQTRNLLLALRVGDPQRVVRALSMEIAFRAASGDPTRHLVVRARALAERLGTPEAQAMVDGAEGWVFYMVADWPVARRLFIDAEVLFRDRCVGVAFMLNSMRVMLYRTLGYMGELGELAARVTPALREVEAQDDHHSIQHLRTGPMTLLGLAADDADGVAVMLESAGAGLPRGAFLVQHYFALLGQCQLDLYRGDDTAAYDRVTAAWPALQRSLLLRIQPIRIMALEQRARCALAAASHRGGAAREALLRVADRDVRRLTRGDTSWARASASILRGSLRLAEGRVDAAKEELADGARRFDALSMPLYAAAARRRQGEIAGGAEGAAVVRAADTELAARGVKDAARMTATMLPRIRS